MDPKAMNIVVAPGDENPAADAMNGVYEHHHQMEPGEFVLDLGAHAGYFTQIASRKIGALGQVLAFEPHPDNYRRWVANCSNLGNASCVNAMAWDEDTVVDLWPSIDNSGGHSHVHVGAGQRDKPIQCPAFDVGAFLKHRHFNPTFIKIDTELSEARIIRSLTRWGVLAKEIAIEVHNQEMWDRCRSDLAGAGYKMTPGEFTNYYLYAWL